MLFLDRYLGDDDIRTLLARDRGVPHALPVAGAGRVRGADLRAVAGCPVVSTPYRYADRAARRWRGAPRRGSTTPGRWPVRCSSCSATTWRVGGAALARCTPSARSTPGRRSAGRCSSCSPGRPRCTSSPAGGTQRPPETPRLSGGSTTSSGWSTASASSSTPPAGPTGPPATASTTSDGAAVAEPWPIARARVPAVRRDGRRSLAFLEDAWGPGTWPAQLHGLRRALAGRAAPRRPRGSGDLGLGEVVARPTRPGRSRTSAGCRDGAGLDR